MSTEYSPSIGRDIYHVSIEYQSILDRDIDRVSTDIAIDMATNVSVEAPHKIHDPWILRLR